MLHLHRVSYIQESSKPIFAFYCVQAVLKYFVPTLCLIFYGHILKVKRVRINQNNPYPKSPNPQHAQSEPINLPSIPISTPIFNSYFDENYASQKPNH